MTHEEFIAKVRDMATARVQDQGIRDKLCAAKMVYGVGSQHGARGVTYYEAWKNGSQHAFVEVCASCEESPVQLAGTTIHELGHVLAGHGTGHGKEWKLACEVLGLTTAQAAGQAYQPSDFAPELWAQIETLPTPTDGVPAMEATRGTFQGLPTFKPRACPLGIGARGGKSRGTGSGSRQRLWQCSHGVKVRVASDDFKATCDVCGSKFARVNEVPATLPGNGSAAVCLPVLGAN